MRPIANQSTVPARFTSWLFCLPLVVLVAVVLLGPSIEGTTDPVSQRSGAWSMSSDLFESGTAVLEVHSPASILDHAANRHDHRDPNSHGDYGCDGIDCSGMMDLALGDSERSLPEFPSSADPGTPIARLAQPPLRPPRIPS